MRTYQQIQNEIEELRKRQDRILKAPAQSAEDQADLLKIEGKIEALRDAADEAHDWEVQEMRRINASARPKYPSGSASPQALDPELREFLTPGSTTKQYWVRPPAEQIVTSVRNYLTTDTGAGSSGAGYWFTPDLYKNVVMGLQAASGVLEANPTLVITNHLRDVQVPVVTADAAATAGVEGADATAAETDGGKVTLGSYRYDGKFTVSAETVLAAEYNVDALMAEFAARSVGAKVAEMLATGDGATEPAGLFTSAIVTAGVTAAAVGAVTSDEMLDLTKSVGKGYRKAGRLVTSDVLHTAMLKWREDSGGAGTGQYLLRSTEDGGYNFAGKPLFVEPQADQGGMSASEVHAVYGDFSGYFVRMTPMLFAKDESNPLVVDYRFAIWIDAKLVDAACVRSLVMHA